MFAPGWSKRVFAGRGRLIVVRVGQMMLCGTLALASARCMGDFAGIEQRNDEGGVNDGREVVRIGGISTERPAAPMSVTKRMSAQPRAAASMASTEKLPGNATAN